MSNTVIWLLPMEFVKRLTALRKQRGLTTVSIGEPCQPFDDILETRSLNV